MKLQHLSLFLSITCFGISLICHFISPQHIVFINTTAAAGFFGLIFTGLAILSRTNKRRF